MPENQLVIKKNGEEVSVEVVIGQTNWATYKIKLWDKNKQNGKTVGDGFSGDQISDKHVAGKPSTVNARYLTWKIRGASFSAHDTTELSATVLIRQGDEVLDGGLFTYAGQFEGVKTIGGFAKLIAS